MRTRVVAVRLLVASLVIVLLVLAGLGFAWSNMHFYWSLKLRIAERGPDAWQHATEDLCVQAVSRGYRLEWLSEGECFVLERTGKLETVWFEPVVGGDWVEATLDMADVYQGAADSSGVEIACYRADQELRVWISPSSSAGFSPDERARARKGLLEVLSADTSRQ